MANVNQIYELVNSAAQEALGSSAITAKDTSTFVALGEQVLKSDSDRDAFYGKLVDRIGRVYFKYKKYETEKDRRILRTPLEFGMALMKVQTAGLAEAATNESWSDNPNPYEKGKDDTDLVVQIYAKRGTFSIDKVIYDYQLETAFTSAEEMGSFVNLIFNDMYNSMELDLHNLSKLCVATAIGTCVHNASTAPNCARNLLKEYKTINADATTLTANTCLYDSGFLKFASREINLVAKRMREMSTLFNTAKCARFTKPEELVVEVLTDFATATASYLESDTYHKELVALPMYEEVNSWQASGTDYGFESTSKVDVAYTGDGAFTASQSGIIAFVRDVEKCGVMYDRIRTKSQYNAIGERTVYSHKADKGWFVDTSENGVVFFVADDE